LPFFLLSSAEWHRHSAEASACLRRPANTYCCFVLFLAAPSLTFLSLQNGIITVLKQRWSPVQQRLLQKVLPVPFKFADIMMDVEGVAAASTHPGDWRYANFDYD
jgi:hypothetical protein